MSLVTADTGITYQFSTPSSPVKPPFITAPDYDGIYDDCYRENKQGQAVFGPKGNGSYSVINSVVQNAVTVSYSGKVANPLAAKALTIGWNFQTTVTVSPSSQTATVSVVSGLTGGVTCFPAHELIVDGVTVATYIPTASNVTYVGLCLTGPASFALVGPATIPGGITFSY